MPTYVYKCDECNHEFEQRQKMTDSALTTCTKCGKEELNRVITASSFILKGTGWYETDFKHKK